MKKYLCVIIAVMAVFVMSASAFGVVYGQAGYESYGYSESTAWEINSAAVLSKVRDDVNSGKSTLVEGGYFKLTKDIDLTSYTDWVSIGGKTRFGGDPSFFTGHFDGGGHTIKVNISKVQLTTDDIPLFECYCALFGVITDGGSVKNLNVEGSVSFAARVHTARHFTGGIAAYLSGGTIENCKFDGTVTTSQLENSTSTIAYAGGIVGYAGKGGFYGSYTKQTFAIVKNCSVGSNSTTTINTKAYNSSTVNYAYAGGLTAFFGDNDAKSILSGNWVKTEMYAGEYGATGAIFAGRSGLKGKLSNNTEVDPNEEPEPSQPAAELTITKTSLAAGTVNASYSDTLTATLSGASVSPTWSVSSGNLPAGLSLNSSTGAITGTPATAGSYTFTVKATISNGLREASKQYTLTISAAQPAAELTITNESLPSGKTGTAYSATLTASAFGMSIQPVWSVSSGNLPAGLSLNTSTGEISGTPTTVDTYTFTVLGTWGTLTGTKNFTITIAKGSGGGSGTGTEEDDVNANPPRFDSANLTLTGQIAVNFYMELPEISGVDYDDGKTCYTGFDINGDTSGNNPQPVDRKFTDKDGYYGFKCYVTSIQMADPITATFYYGDGKSVQQSYSVKRYLDNMINRSTTSTEMKNLAVAIKNYGHYAQIYLDRVNDSWELGTDHVALEAASSYTDDDIASVKSAVAPYKIASESYSGSGIKSPSYSLNLDSETTINLTFTMYDNFTGDLHAYLNGGTTDLAVKQTDGIYRVRISNIAAHELADTQTVKICVDKDNNYAGKEFTIKASGLTFVYNSLYNNMAEDRQQAAVAFYKYYEATTAYRNTK